MDEKLRILIVEDEPADAELAEAELRRAGLAFELRRVETEAGLRGALASFRPDVILADFTLPGFDALGVLAVVRSVSPATPVLVVTGTIDEETAVSCLRAGAADYLLKDRLGRLAAAVRSALDSSRTEENRRLLSTAVGQADESIVITGRDATIQWVNPAFERVTGYGREEVVGRNPRFLRSGRQDRAITRELWETLARGEVWRGRIANRRKDRSLVELDSTISPVRDSSGAVTHFVAVQRDVTREMALQRQLELSQRTEALGRMAGGVAHDFNNLLGVVRGYAEFLLRYPQGPAETRAALEEMVRAADRGARLTSQLLAFGGRQVLKPHPVDLRATIAEMEGMLLQILGDTVTLDVVAPEPVWVLVDSSRLEQVVMNLVINARDAMPEGGRLTIEIRARRDEEGSPAPALLRIADTGEGMAPEVLAHLFEPFFTTKAPGKGTGLGLATVYGVVVQSGGAVAVDSAPGRGTSFEISLPEAAPDEAGAGEDARPAPRGRETVLLVDVQAEFRGIVARALSEAGYRVVEAAGAGEAVRLAAAEGRHLDLLVVAVDLAGASGPELARRLRRDVPGLKAIFLSGSGAGVPATDGVSDGGGRVVRKPFRLEELARAVREVLDA